jgi:hypothetical protein
MHIAPQSMVSDPDSFPMTPGLHKCSGQRHNQTRLPQARVDNILVCARNNIIPLLSLNPSPPRAAPPWAFLFQPVLVYLSLPRIDAIGTANNDFFKADDAAHLAGCLLGAIQGRPSSRIRCEISPPENSHFLKQDPNPDEVLILLGPPKGEDGLPVLPTIKHGQVHVAVQAQARFHEVFHHVSAALMGIYPFQPTLDKGIMRPRRRMSQRP